MFKRLVLLLLVNLVSVVFFAQSITYWTVGVRNSIGECPTQHSRFQIKTANPVINGEIASVSDGQIVKCPEDSDDIPCSRT